MSDLAATNCGCGCDCNSGGNGCNIIWLILILCCCGGNGGCGFGSGCGCEHNNGCNWIWIILLLCCCGGNGGCGSFCPLMERGGVFLSIPSILRILFPSIRSYPFFQSVFFSPGNMALHSGTPRILHQSHILRFHL